MLRKTVLAHALSFAFGATALTIGVMHPAMAQSNATGNIVGTVPAPSGASVVVRSLDTGFRREIPIDANGRFQATSLPVGRYQVELMRNAQVADSTEVEVIIGQGANASFAAAGMQTVRIAGVRNRIDVTNTNNGATFSARELAALPIQRNMEAIIQLAPNTTRADDRFAGGASFGGGAASENSYYINGFPVVNPLTGLGASQLPFGAIAQAQVLTGGFGAEFGRSIGGVVNITTKSGTNNWEVGAMVSYAPKSLRAKPEDLYYSVTGAQENAATDGTLRRRRSDTEVDEKLYGVYVGGPIIQDRLFMFLSADQTDRQTTGVNPIGAGERLSTSLTRNGWRDTDTDIKRYMAKLDWNITDNHRLEFTSLGDTPVVSHEFRSYDYATGAAGSVVNSSQKLTNVDNNGGKTNMLKYTGNLTDALTLTGLVGRTKSTHENVFPNFDPNAVLFSVVAPSNARAPGLTYNDVQPLTGNILAPGSGDIVKSYRLDLEYKLGSHTIRGGVDKIEVESMNAGEFKAGGGTWTYARTDNPNQVLQGTGGSIPPVASGGGLGLQGYYVSKGLFSTVTSSYGIQDAQYLEDRYQVTRDLLLTAGIRRESFTNQNGDRQTFLEMKNQYNPRLAVAWDVNGDSSFKLSATAGRYSVPIPTHITVRGAGRSTFTDQYFTYTGVDANGQPTGLVQLTAPQSGNNEFGQEKDIKTLAALDMKPSYQDELTLGMEKAFSPTLNFGAKVTYRKLKSTIDDFCDVRPFEAYAGRNNIAITNPLWGNTCQTFNPGETNTFYVDYQGGGTNDQLVTLTPAEMGFGKPKRTYAALDLFAEHPLRDGWYGRINYTLSRNEGNTEGQVRSDNGQADVAVTSTWDYPELMLGAEGRLPNDRKHQIKAYGFYQVTPEFTVGANLLLASGRPRSCIGTEPNPAATGSPGYTNQTFYCGGATRAQNVIIPRGTLGELPWDKRLDLSVEYRPQIVKGLSLRMEVFNVTDTQEVTSVSEARNVRGNTRIASTYESPLSYSVPRSVRFTAAYDMKF